MSMRQWISRRWKGGIVAAGLCAVGLGIGGGLTAAEPAGDGFVPLFNGTSLEGWDGDPKFWRVENGVIVGESTKENVVPHNTFLIWRGGEVENFEITFEYRMSPEANSGLQYRSFEAPGTQWVVGGYQADVDGSLKYSGIVYGEKDRGILAQRGTRTIINKDGKPQVDATFGSGEELATVIRKDEWNAFHVIAQGNKLTHKINGVRMSEVIDEDDVVTTPGEKGARTKGIVALQLHKGPAMKVEFRNIRLKRM
jgi:hypothetical protein